MSFPDLAVIGAGPKGISVALRSYVYEKLGLKSPRVLLIEKNTVGNNWLISGGWTNGRHRLGTSPLKDLGFPYKEVDAEIAWELNKYSWSAYLMANDKFARWVDNCQPYPKHCEWADYLNWVVNQTNINVLKGRLVSAEIESDNFNNTNRVWKLNLVNERSEPIDSIYAKGLMFTGPGDPKSNFPSLNGKVLGVKEFWQLENPTKFFNSKKIIIVGSGESCGSIIQELQRHYVESILVVSPTPVIYSRGEGFFENTYFSDPIIWDSFSEASKKDFINHTDRGVISLSAQKTICELDTVKHLQGRVINISSTAAENVKVEIRNNSNKFELEANLVIDAQGADQMWFMDYLSVAVKQQFNEVFGTNLSLEILEKNIATDLSLANIKPKLFLPQLAALQQGPGFPNLSCLGLLAQRVISGFNSK